MNKKIIITGTSRGIGLEMLKFLAAEGHQVLALSRNEQPVQQLKLPGVESFSCDISKTQDLEKVQEFIEKKWGQVDILINNAGAIVNKPFPEISLTEFRTIYETNVIAVAGLIQKLLPFMREASHVLSVSSMGAVQGSVKFPGLSAYSSSKAAIISLTELLAEEYKETGPAFNVLALGAVQTEMLEEAFPGYKAPVSASEMAEYIAKFALTGNKFYNGKILQVSNSTP